MFLLSVDFLFTVPVGLFCRLTDFLLSAILLSWYLIRAFTTSCSVVFLILLMSVLKASSALTRARALYCNVFGHVPIWECLFRVVRASSDCSIILSSDSVSLFSALISFLVLWFVFFVRGGSASVLPLVFLLFSVFWRSLAWFRVRFRKVAFFFIVCFVGSIDIYFANVKKVIVVINLLTDANTELNNFL